MNFNSQGFTGQFQGGGVESLNTNSVRWDALQLQLQFWFEYDFNLLYNYHKLIFLFDDTPDSSASICFLKLYRINTFAWVWRFY